MTRGYLFPSISRDAEGGAPIRGKAPMSAAEMTHALKSHARRQARRLTSRCTLSVRGGAITRALRGEDLSSIMERAVWKRPSCGMEAHEHHGSSVTRRGRKRGGKRGLGGAVLADQRFLVA